MIASRIILTRDDNESPFVMNEIDDGYCDKDHILPAYPMSELRSFEFVALDGIVLVAKMVAKLGDMSSWVFIRKDLNLAMSNQVIKGLVTFVDVQEDPFFTYKIKFDSLQKAISFLNTNKDILFPFPLPVIYRDKPDFNLGVRIGDMSYKLIMASMHNMNTSNQYIITDLEGNEIAREEVFFIEDEVKTDRDCFRKFAGILSSSKYNMPDQIQALRAISVSKHLF